MRLFHRWRRTLTSFMLVASLSALLVKIYNFYVTSQPMTSLQDDALRQHVDDVTTQTTTRHVMAPISNQSQECDIECRRFHALLTSSWPADKPRAVIYYLVQRKRLDKLNTSIQYLDTNFNNKYQYPVIVFIEEDLDNESGRQQIRSFTGSDPPAQSRLFIQPVHFRLPDFLTKLVPKRAGNGKSIGYRHMCRFHAKTVYEHPILAAGSSTLADGRAEVEFAWRLDDDSYLYRPVEYDVFAFMRDRRLEYGYVQIRDEAPSLIRGLWESVDAFLASSVDKPPAFYASWRRTKIYYTNFELSALSVWMSAGYRHYIEHVDRAGGIYYHRWGDAPIKTIGVTLFVERDRTHRFADVPYKHSTYTNRGASAKRKRSKL